MKASAYKRGNATESKRESNVPAARDVELPAQNPQRHGVRPSCFSKTTRMLATCGLLMALVLCVAVSAQYAIDWFTIDDGGGTSTGGAYTVSGTIGQPDAGEPMTGGPYTLRGGFWSVQAIQTPGAPLLTIVNASLGQVTISWTPDTPGWVLQENLSLAPANWTESPSGSINPVTVSVDVPEKFYRLFKP